MKWFLLLMMACAAVAIFYFRDDIQEAINKNTSSDSDTQPEEVVSTGLGSTGTPDTTGSTGGTRPAGSPKRPPVDPVDPRPGTKGDDQIASRYPMPKFNTIEQAVGNWMAIPPSAFPRQIKINKVVKIVLPGGIGSSSIPAGSGVFALSSRNGILTIGKSKQTSARGQISIDDTDYKQVLGKEFDAWKAKQQGMVMKKRDRYRKVLTQTREAAKNLSKPTLRVSTSSKHEAELGKKPDQLTDGSVPLMIASMKRGDVTEITPDIIENWGPIIREVVDGEAYWTATVDYETFSMFGGINTEAQALMRFGKVLGWVYTGSGESVP